MNRFFLTYADFISGRVLEIQQSGYTLRFGRSVSVRDTLDIDARFAPTHLCDLAKADRLVPSEMYDCFLLPNTAQHLRDLENALVQARRIVKPGGVILLTAAGFLPLIPDGPDYWRLTVDGWRELTARVWPDDDVEVTGYGNVLAAVAALHGIVCEELTEAELDVHDPRYPVTVGVCCRKQSDPIR